MRFRNLVAAATLITAGALGACGPDAVTGISVDELFGTWVMVSTGGQTLPASSTTLEDCTFTIIAEQITFNPDATFEVSAVTSLACDDEEPEPVTDVGTGTYRVSGGLLHLLFEGESFETSLPAGINNSRLTLSVNQNGQTSLLVFQRQ